ncbi:MAG: hypothetical protein P8K66_06080 [Planctomycetota bacterium]|nr:hypothetical protein [Planctomycetota bacterium]
MNTLVRTLLLKKSFSFIFVLVSIVAQALTLDLEGQTVEASRVSSPKGTTDLYVSAEILAPNQARGLASALRKSGVGSIPVMLTVTNQSDSDLVIAVDFQSINYASRQKSYSYRSQISILKNSSKSVFRGIPYGYYIHWEQAINIGFSLRVLEDSKEGFPRWRYPMNAMGYQSILDLPNYGPDGSSKIPRALRIWNNIKVIGSEAYEPIFDAEIPKKYSPIALPESIRPLLAIQQVYLEAVGKNDLSVGQREALDAAVSRGLIVVVIPGPEGEGLDWISSSNGSADLKINNLNIHPQKLGAWIVVQKNEGAFSLKGLKNLVYQGPGVLMKATADNQAEIVFGELNLGNPSNWALSVGFFYIFLLIPCIGVYLKKRRQLSSLIWVQPALCLLMGILIFVIGIIYYGIDLRSATGSVLIFNERNNNIENQDFEANERVCYLQVVEGVFNPTSRTHKRTLGPLDEFCFLASSLQRYSRIVFEENESGNLVDTRYCYPRSITFLVNRSFVELDQSIPETLNRFTNGSFNEIEGGWIGPFPEVMKNNTEIEIGELLTRDKLEDLELRPDQKVKVMGGVK